MKDPGCLLLPLLLNACSEYIMFTLFEKWQTGVTIRGRKIYKLRYADDILMIVVLREAIETIMNRFSAIKIEYSLKLHT